MSTQRPARLDAPPLATDGVVSLRPWRADLVERDLDDVVAGQDGAFVHWLEGDRVATRGELAAWLSGNALAWEQQRPVVDVAIELGSGELVGFVGVGWGVPEVGAGRANLTYGVLARHRGRGIATRAVRLWLPLVQDRWPVGEFVIRCHPDNRPSASVAVRLGFVRLGRVGAPGEELDWYVLPVR